MNKKEKSKKVKATNSNHENISLESKVIEKSLDSKIDYDSIDNANAYYSERYGWTLRKN
tara:strand:+ start:255 stop:431 length:177 start_codon:yes stop_codon:yes gene_type:complete